MAKARVVILTGPFLWHKNTVKEFIQSDVNLVGVCFCDQTDMGLPLQYIKHAIKKRGFLMTLGQIFGRIYYKLFNRKKDNELFNKLYNEDELNEVVNEWPGETHQTRSYSDPETMKWLKSLEADIFVVHSGYWIGKKVRDLPKLGYVIGGHPGMIPQYRGSHSAFWALMHGKPEMVGFSVFHLAKEVDAGDLIYQNSLSIEPGDSYVSLGWKGMKEIAKNQVRVIEEFDQGQDIPRIPHKEIPADSEFHVPTLFQYLRYRMKQKSVR